MLLARGRHAFSGADTWLAHWILVVPILLFVTFMSARQLDLVVPEVDEFYFMNDTGMLSDSPYSPLDVLASMARNSPNHTPLYFILLNVWGRLVGYEIALARVLTVFCGLLSLAMIYRLARDFIAPLAGHLALIVVVSNAFFNFYYANARMYPLLVLTGACTLWLYLRLCQGDRKAKTGDFLALTAACYALANTHVFSALLFVALGVYHLLHVRKDRRWLNVSLAVLAGLLLFSPWLSVLFTHGLERNNASMWPDSDNLGQVLAALHAVTFNGSSVLSLLAIVGLIMGWRERTIAVARPILIGLYFLAAFSLVAQLSEAFGVSKVRFALAVWPAFLLVIVGGLYGLYRWRRGLGIFVLLWIAAGLSFQQVADWPALFAGRERPFAQPAWHIVSRLAQQSQPTAPILTYLVDLTGLHWPAYINYPQSRYYFADRGLELVTPADYAAFREYVFLHSIEEPFLRVFYQTSRVGAPEMSALDAILEEANYQVCDVRRFGVDTVLVTYGWPVLGCHDAQAMASQSTEVLDYDLFGARVDAAGHKVLFVDRWKARKDFPAEGYNLSHQLISADWERVAQLDLPLVHENNLRQFSIDIREAPAGRYRLMAILYDNQTGERFNWIDNPGDPPYMLALAEVEIPE